MARFSWFVTACMALSLGSTPIVLAQEKKTFAEPQEVFDFAASAFKKKDLKAAYACLTDESREAEAALTIALCFYALDRPQNDPEAKKETKQIMDVLEKHGATKEAFGKIKVPKLDPDKDAEKIKAFMAEIGRSLVKDRTAFLAETHALLNKAGVQSMKLVQDNAKLVDLKIAGDSAKGVMVYEKSGKEKRDAIEFKKTTDGWLIDLPAKQFAFALLLLGRK